MTYFVVRKVPLGVNAHDELPFLDSALLCVLTDANARIVDKNVDPAKFPRPFDTIMGANVTILVDIGLPQTVRSRHWPEFRRQSCCRSRIDFSDGH